MGMKEMRGKKNHRYHKITIKWNRKHKNTNREEIDIFISAFYDPTWKTWGRRDEIEKKSEWRRCKDVELKTTENWSQFVITTHVAWQVTTEAAKCFVFQKENV